MHHQSPGLNTWQTQISEADALWGVTSGEVSATHLARCNLPIIILTADGTYAATAPQVRSTVEALWTQWHQELAVLSGCGEEHAIAHSSHLQLIDRPDAIIVAINDVMAITPNRCGANARSSSSRAPRM